MPFENQFFGSLDLERAVHDQYGQAATLATASEHLYDWRARVQVSANPPQYLFFPLSISAAVTTQYGPNWAPVALGVHRFDWRAVRFADLDCKVLPVMLVACDRFFDIEGVRSGLDHFRSVLESIQAWYKLRTGGKTFRLVQPLIIPTRSPSARWNELSARTNAIPEERYVLMQTALDEYARSLPSPGPNLSVVLAIYVGDSPDVYLGAAEHGRFAVVPPRATSVTCPISGPLDARCADATYAVGHELGHTFGLCHACDSHCGFPNNPQCGLSIMETTRPPDAILLNEEIAILLKTCFFDGTARKGKIAQRVQRPRVRPDEACVITPEGPLVNRLVRSRKAGKARRK